jgi:hypothetical protein
VETEGDRRGITFRSIAITVGFVATIQLVALYFTYVNAPITSQTGYSYAPAGTSSLGSATNAITLVLAVFATTLVAVWLVRSKRVRVFTSIVFVGTALALFLLTLLTALDATGDYLNEYSSFYLSLGFAVVALAIYAVSTQRPKLLILAPFITGLLSAEVGSYFASTIPLLTALLLPVVFSIYDIYAVFKGPLKQLVTLAPAGALNAVTSRVGEFSIGTGDTIFYSMLPGIALYWFSLHAAILTMVAVDAGVVLTLYLLSRSKILPGLPIPMALGLVAIAVAAFL